MELSILIVNWNTREHLRTCLQSVFDSVRLASFEVVVVDNDSSDGSSQMVRSDFGRAVLIENPRNAGFAEANNQAYAKSKGRIIALLNPDTTVYPETFEKMIAYLDAHQEVGAVSCRLLDPDGSFQWQYFRRFPSVRTIFFRYAYFGQLLDQRVYQGRALDSFFYREKSFQETETIEQPGAACLLIRRSLIEQIGLFDEQFPIFFNDVDLCRRIWNTGYEIHVLSHAQITHFGGSSIRKLPSGDVSRLATEGLYRYFKKHRGQFYASLVLCLLYADAWLSKSLKPNST